jgi:hypothetical protein
MKTQGLSFRHAVELLKSGDIVQVPNDKPVKPRYGTPPTRYGTPPKIKGLYSPFVFFNGRNDETSVN